MPISDEFLEHYPFLVAPSGIEAQVTVEAAHPLGLDGSNVLGC